MKVLFSQKGDRVDVTHITFNQSSGVRHRSGGVEASDRPWNSRRGLLRDAAFVR